MLEWALFAVVIGILLVPAATLVVELFRVRDKLDR